MYGHYAWYKPESPSLDDQSCLPEYVPVERLPRTRKPNRFMPYGVPPRLSGGRLPEATYDPDLSPVAGSMPEWGLGVEGYTWDPPLETYGEGYLEQVLSGKPLLATDACLDPIFEDSSQYGDDLRPDNRFDPIVERGVPVAEPGCHHPGVAENGVAPPSPQLKLTSAIHRATALGFHAVQQDLTEASSGTNLIPTANVTSNAQERRRSRGRWAGKTKAKAKPKPKPKPMTEFVCEECTLARGVTVSYNCAKDLKRHKRTTKAHAARNVLFCSCGKGVTRMDAMKLHHRWCDGHTLKRAAAGLD